MDFASAMKHETIKTYTENGATAFNSTGVSDLLDLYALVGGMRERQDDVLDKFQLSCDEDLLLAFKLAFYTRDVRGGLGERDSFRTMLRYLAHKYPEELIMNLHLIPYYGRWDDLFCLIDTPCAQEMAELVWDQLVDDRFNAMITDTKISLLAKWMPSINTSSEETRKKAMFFIKRFNMSQASYRKMLSALRARLKIVECQMSAQEWNEITYSQVPSRAMMRYRDAFKNHDEERFEDYLEKVEEGKEKINAGTLYPYDLVGKYIYASSFWLRSSISEEDPVIEAQWKALPNYIDEGQNIIVMADVSGSMLCCEGRPMASAVGLAIYFSERNNSAYKDMFMTFSSSPAFVKLKGNSLRKKVDQAVSSDWGGSTNLEAAFEEVLRVAVENKIAREDMPKAIVVISDMEINYCAGRDWSFYDEMVKRFAAKGYEIPNIVFWNVESRQDTFLVDGNRKGVQLISGQSASTFRNVINAIGMTPYEAMLNTLNSERYNPIVIGR